MANDDLQPMTNNSASSAPAPQGNRGDLVLKAPAENPRAQGHSPAMEQRREAARSDQQQQPAQKIKIGDAEYSEDEVRSALTERADRAVKAQSVPKDHTGYKPELPKDFKAPEGTQF